MKKVLGIFILLVVVCLYTGTKNPAFFKAANLYNTIRWSSLYAILGVGVAFVIITGGIDLSIGSVVGLVGTTLLVLTATYHWPVVFSVGAVLLISIVIGLAHGLLITKMRLQPFIVTLCGLLIYRGLARLVPDDETGNFSGHPWLSSLAHGKPFSLNLGVLDAPLPIPMPLLILIGVALLAGLFLNFTVWGRYLFALGRNEQAARYSGINTDRMTILAYVLCSLVAGIGGILFSQELNSIQPASLGEVYELYAIAAAVLGGCSLRGGEGTILGVIIGATLMRVIYNAINILGIRTYLEYSVVGVVILLGVIADELVKRYAARRRVTKQRRGFEVSQPPAAPPPVIPAPV